MDLLEDYKQTVEKPKIIKNFNHSAKYLTLINRAYAIMLKEQGYLSREDYLAIDKGLVEVQNHLTAQDMDPHKVDLYYNFENALYQEIGEDTACKLHVGRSRNDISFTEIRMQYREAISGIVKELLQAQAQLEDLIEKNTDVIIPYYTYGQPAQPGTWAHYLLTVYDNFRRSICRLQAAYEKINRCPMGAAASIGSSFNIDKTRLAHLLGFDSPLENTLDAIGSVDQYIETEADFAIINSTLNKIASDFMFFASTECNILNCDMSICSGSSIMPQKKNAGVCENLRSMTCNYTGFLMTTFCSNGSITMFPSLETFAQMYMFWENYDILVSEIRTLRLILEKSHINKDIAYAKARDGFTAATAMAEELTKECGEPFVKTHHVVGNMIHKLMDEDRLKVENMTSELMKDASMKALGFEIHHTDEEIQQMMDPLQALNAKTTGGTPKPEDTLKLLAEGKKETAEQKKWLDSADKQISDAYAEIEKGIA